MCTTISPVCLLLYWSDTSIHQSLISNYAGYDALLPFVFLYSLPLAHTHSRLLKRGYLTSSHSTSAFRSRRALKALIDSFPLYKHPTHHVLNAMNIGPCSLRAWFVIHQATNGSRSVTAQVRAIKSSANIRCGRVHFLSHQPCSGKRTPPHRSASETKRGTQCNREELSCRTT